MKKYVVFLLFLFCIALAACGYKFSSYQEAVNSVVDEQIEEDSQKIRQSSKLLAQANSDLRSLVYILEEVNNLYPDEIGNNYNKFSAIADSVHLLYLDKLKESESNVVNQEHVSVVYINAIYDFYKLELKKICME